MKKLTGAAIVVALIISAYFLTDTLTKLADHNVKLLPAQVALLSFHPADANSDSRLDQTEMNSYMYCWKTGCNFPTPPSPIPLDYANSVAFLWKTGELYHYDSGSQCPQCYKSGAGATTPSTTWLRSFGAAGSSSSGRALAFDQSGNIYVAAAFSGSINIDGHTFTSAGGQDVIIAKYAPDGTYQWARRFGGAAGENAASIAVANDGTIAIGGTYGGGTANLGLQDISPFGSNDAFVAVYGNDGTPLWSRGFGGGAVDTITGVSFDSSSNVIFAGTFQSTVSFGGQPFSSVDGGTDQFLAKYAKTGAHLWSKTFANSGEDFARALTVDAADNIYLSGYFTSWVNLGGSNLISSDPLFGGPEVYIAKFNSAGSHIWSNRYGSDKTERAIAIAIDPNNDILLTGDFNPYTNFCGTQFSSTISTYPDVFVAKFSGADGICKLARKIGGAQSKMPSTIAADRSGNIYTAGSFQGTLTSGTASVTSVGYDDIYVAKFDNSGNPLSLKSFGGARYDSVSSLRVGADGYPVITGAYMNAATFDGTTVTAIGSQDMFLLKAAQ